MHLSGTVIPDKCSKYIKFQQAVLADLKLVLGDEERAHLERTLRAAASVVDPADVPQLAQDESVPSGDLAVVVADGLEECDEVKSLRLANARLNVRLTASRLLAKTHKRKLGKSARALAAEKRVTKKLRAKLQEQRFHRGTKNHKLSIRGGMQLAARRALTNVGSQGIGLVLGIDVAGKTVRAWEAPCVKTFSEKSGVV